MSFSLGCSRSEFFTSSRATNASLDSTPSDAPADAIQIAMSGVFVSMIDRQSGHSFREALANAELTLNEKLASFGLEGHRQFLLLINRRDFIIEIESMSVYLFSLRAKLEDLSTRIHERNTWHRQLGPYIVEEVSSKHTLPRIGYAFNGQDLSRCHNFGRRIASLLPNVTVAFDGEH